METHQFKQSSHLNPALSDPATATLSVDKLLGRWKNTNPETQGLSEILIARDGARFLVSPFGVGSVGRIAWPTTEAVALANLEEEAGQRAVALAVTFDFGFMTADTHLRVNKGVLVIVLFISFRDRSGRSDYVNREFFYRAAEADG
jgi:hypothetical protein